MKISTTKYLTQTASLDLIYLLRKKKRSFLSLFPSLLLTNQQEKMSTGQHKRGRFPLLDEIEDLLRQVQSLDQSLTEKAEALTEKVESLKQLHNSISVV